MLGEVEFIFLSSCLCCNQELKGRDTEVKVLFESIPEEWARAKVDKGRFTWIKQTGMKNGGKGSLLNCCLALGHNPLQLLEPVSHGIQCPLELHGVETVRNGIKLNVT